MSSQKLFTGIYNQADKYNMQNHEVYEAKMEDWTLLIFQQNHQFFGTSYLVIINCLGSKLYVLCINIGVKVYCNESLANCRMKIFRQA